MFGEGIIDRLPLHSKLNQSDNPMRLLLINTAGALLDDYNSNLESFFDSCFLTEAAEEWLNTLGVDFNIPRKIGENDTDYRNRIVYEQMGHLTSNYLVDVYNVKLYTKVDDFNKDNNTLVSDNPYIMDNGFMMLTDRATKDILDKKFVLGEEVLWLIL